MNKASSSSIIKDLDEHTPENERTVIQKLMQTNQVVKYVSNEGMYIFLKSIL
jgi:hypothetical protein